MPPTRRSSEGAGRQSLTSARRSGRARGGVRPERRWLRPAGCYPPGTSFTPSDRCGGEGKRGSRTSSDPATGTAFASPRKRDCSRSPSPRSARGRMDTRSRKPRPWPSPPSPRFCGRRRKRPGWSDSSCSTWRRFGHTTRPSRSCDSFRGRRLPGPSARGGPPGPPPAPGAGGVPLPSPLLPPAPPPCGLLRFPGAPSAGQGPRCRVTVPQESAPFPRGGLSEGMAHGAHVDDALCFAVYPQQGVHLVVEEGGHLAASEPEPDSRQRQILRDVPRVEVDVPVGPLAVFPLGAGEDGRPDERGGGLGAELLEQRRAGKIPPEIPRGHLLEKVAGDAVMVHTALSSFHAVGNYVGIDRVQGTGGGDGSELMAPLLPLDARGGPQEKGDLLQAKRPGGVLPDASPQGQDLHEREADRRSRQGKPDDLRAGIFLVQGRPGGPVDPPSPQPSALVFRFLLKPVSDSFGFLHGGVTPIRIPFR